MAAGLFRLPLAALLLQRAAGLRLRAAPAPRTPKVFYLFMLKDIIMHEDIWADYFSQGVRGTDYEAFIHCSDHSGCQRRIKRRNWAIFSQIATVPSWYCANLIDPMMALLAAAYNASDPNDAGFDKFVFVSGDSVPVKPFETVHRTLTGGDPGVAYFSLQKAGGCHKASQWSVLSRPQVSRLLDLAGQPVEKQNRWSCLGAGGGKVANLVQARESSEYRKAVCNDEYWPMMAAFGRNASDWQTEPDPKLMRALRIQDFMWVDWGHPAWSWNRGRITLSRARAVGASTGNVSKAKGDLGPATVMTFTRKGLREFASSHYLFMRKVTRKTALEDSNMTLQEAFRKLVFGL